MHEASIIAYQRGTEDAIVRLFRLFDCVGARGDELVRGVVLVRGDEECAAEAGTGLADGAAEGVFIRTRPARRGESRGAFDRF